MSRPIRFPLVNGTGSHRVNTPDELAGMLGEPVYRRYRVVNHNAHDPGLAGTRRVGIRWHARAVQPRVRPGRSPHRARLHRAAFLRRLFRRLQGGLPRRRRHRLHHALPRRQRHRRPAKHVGRSRREPHAGDHPAQRLATSGRLPRQRDAQPPAGDRARFCGSVLAAHEEGCRYAATTAMVPCPRAYPLVLTTNSGYPLDQNLSQAVKGMSAAAQIVEQGGLIVTAARCNDGFPAHGNFRTLLFDHPSPKALLDTDPGARILDVRPVGSPDPGHDPAPVPRGALQRDPAGGRAARPPGPRARPRGLPCLRDPAPGADAPVAVLPEGPMTIPYVDAKSAIPPVKAGP